MLHLKKLSNLKYFLILFFLGLVSISIEARETKWEVAIVFRGEGEDIQFQKDVDDNILELTRLTPSNRLKIGLYRELEGKSYIYSPNETSKKLVSIGSLLYRQDINHILISGKFKQNNDRDLKSFLKSFYKDINSKKALIVYSHGKGAEGLRNLSIKNLKENLESTPHLDFLWFDACFMANLEFLYELKENSDYTIASEEAEFASGLPFQALADLQKLTTGREAALLLAKNFIESYSYLKNGKQKNYVSVSSATISVIENKKLNDLALLLNSVSFLYKNLIEEDKNKLIKTLLKNASMDDKSMVDLGQLLIQLRKINDNAESDRLLTKLIRLLNIEAVKNLKTNSRIHISVPTTFSNPQIVFGFNNWTKGSPIDFSSEGPIKNILKNDGFTVGPKEALWPVKNLNTSSDLLITPFAPGINVFNYYFINSKNGKILTETQSVSRTHDVVESSADSDLTPLAYTAYTQQIGTKAERYTGLNITIPGTIPSLNYYELEFNQLVGWLSL